MSSFSDEVLTLICHLEASRSGKWSRVLFLEVISGFQECPLGTQLVFSVITKAFGIALLFSLIWSWDEYLFDLLALLGTLPSGGQRQVQAEASRWGAPMGW